MKNSIIKLISLLFLCGSWSEAASIDYIHAEGRRLVYKEKSFVLKAVCFSNNYSFISNPTELLSSKHHSEEDFKKIKEMGFNSIRFAFKGEWFEKDPKVFWKWLDQNIAWARKNEVFLILDLHVPIGGFWLHPTSKKVDYRLWTDSRIKQKNLDMWRAISKRYKNEPYVAAYDILNEPVTTDSTGEQWVRLAQELVDQIRIEDKRHLIIVEKLYGVKKNYGTKGLQSQFLVKDSNVMYLSLIHI